jgi:hypothetical protein
VRVLVLAVAGDTTADITHRVDLKALDKRYTEAMWSRIFPADGSSFAMLSREQLEKHVKLPPFIPPIDDMRFDWNGDLWLAREDDRVGKNQDWEVIEIPSGRRRFRTSLPRELQVFAIRDGVVYGVVKDQLDVPHIVRFQPT